MVTQAENLPVKATRAALARQTSFADVVRHWNTYVSICQSIAQSGKAGKLRTPEQVLAVAIQGSELGLAPMTSVNWIDPIEGRLSIKAACAQALVLRDLPGSRFEIEEGDDYCEVRLSVPDRPNYTARFTVEMAQKAGLVKPDSNWEKYQDDMLFSKAVLRAVRRVAPDVLCGMYSPEELGEVQTEEPVTIDVGAPAAPAIESAVEDALASDETAQCAATPALEIATESDNASSLAESGTHVDPTADLIHPYTVDRIRGMFKDAQIPLAEAKWMIRAHGAERLDQLGAFEASELIRDLERRAVETGDDIPF